MGEVVRALPGALANGTTRAEALAAVQALVLRILADRLEHGESARRPLTVSFATSRGAAGLPPGPEGSLRPFRGRAGR
jgi:hypothetical protein